jgi:putative transposase
MDDYHLYSAARYIELNPLRAGLCNTAESWQWSSARAHLCVVTNKPGDLSVRRQLLKGWKRFVEEQ